MNPTQRMRTIGAWWGIGGVILLLCWAIFRLTPYAVEAIQMGLLGWQWLVLAAWTAFMVASEGYDGFYKRLAPRIVERARLLKRKGNSIELLLAPLYCLQYFNAPRKRMLIAYTAIFLIILAIVIVHQLPQPWRGIIDFGVVSGLGAGIIAIVSRVFRRSR